MIDENHKITQKFSRCPNQYSNFMNTIQMYTTEPVVLVTARKTDTLIVGRQLSYSTLKCRQEVVKK